MKSYILVEPDFIMDLMYSYEIDYVVRILKYIEYEFNSVEKLIELIPVMYMGDYPAFGIDSKYKNTVDINKINENIINIFKKIEDFEAVCSLYEDYNWEKLISAYDK